MVIGGHQVQYMQGMGHHNLFKELDCLYGVQIGVWANFVMHLGLGSLYMLF